MDREEKQRKRGSTKLKTENKNKNMNVYRASFRREAGFIQNKSEAQTGLQHGLGL